jgi:hypothetical protein
MGETATASAVGAASAWEARPLTAQAPAGRWGLRYRPTGRWIAYGSEARCRALAAQLAAADAILAGLAPPRPGRRAAVAPPAPPCVDCGGPVPVPRRPGPTPPTRCRVCRTRRAQAALLQTRVRPRPRRGAAAALPADPAAP